MNPRTPPLKPLLVVTNGLRGTIRPVMDVLLRMEEVTSEWCPLTDRRVLVWLARHAKVLAGATTETPEWNHEALFYPPIEGERTTRRIAGFPGPAEHVGCRHDGQLLWQRMLQANWGFYCDRVPRGPSTRFYAEPVPEWLPPVLAEAGIPHRVVVIARDPRGEVAELWHAGRRNGALPVAVNAVDTPMTLAERQCSLETAARIADLRRMKSTRETICVRYEDLIERTTAAWDRIRDWLGLPHRDAAPAPTTGDEWPESRWRPFVPDAANDLYRVRMGEHLEGLGYAI